MARTSDKRRSNVQVASRTLWCARLCNNILGHCVLFLCFRSEKIQNLMMEGSKETFTKKIIESISGKVNEGAQIKKTFDKFLEKLMRVTK